MTDWWPSCRCASGGFRTRTWRSGPKCGADWPTADQRTKKDCNRALRTSVRTARGKEDSVMPLFFIFAIAAGALTAGAVTADVTSDARAARHQAQAAATFDPSPYATAAD